MSDYEDSDLASGSSLLEHLSDLTHDPALLLTAGLEGGDHVVSHVLERAADLDERLVDKLYHFRRNVGFKLEVIVQVHCLFNVSGLVLGVDDVLDVGHEGVHRILGHDPVTQDTADLAARHTIVTDRLLQEHHLGQGHRVHPEGRDGLEGDQALADVVILHASGLNGSGQVELNGLGGAGGAASNNVLQLLDLDPARLVLIVQGLVHPDGNHHVLLRDLGVVPRLEDGLLARGLGLLLQHAEVLHGLGQVEGVGALLGQGGEDHQQLGAVLGGDAACRDGLVSENNLQHEVSLDKVETSREIER